MALNDQILNYQREWTTMHIDGMTKKNYWTLTHIFLKRMTQKFIR